METHKKLPLEYVIREPQVRTKRSPVIFMLHGYGSNEEDLFSFADELPKEYTIISLRAPYNLTSFGYASKSVPTMKVSAGKKKTSKRRR